MAIETYQTAKGQTLYRATAFSNGKRVRKRGFKTKRDAKKWIAAVSLGDNIPKVRGFKDLATEWLTQYKPTVAASTYNKTRVIINHAIDHFGDTNISGITQADAQNLANSWSYEYVNYKKMIAYTSSIFKYAIANDIIAKNPFDNIRMPKQHKESEQTDLWTLEQLSIFLETCKADKRQIIYPFFRVLVYTGMRRQEILALEWSDYDGRSLHIKQAITLDYDNHPVVGDTKNKSSIREVALDAGTIEALNAWKAWAMDTRIFPVGLQRPNKWMHEITEKAILPHLTPHKLRHMHCTILLQSGANIKDVQERLGHSDVQTTLNVYAHANKNKQLTADIFSKALETAPQTAPEHR